MQIGCTVTSNVRNYNYLLVVTRTNPRICLGLGLGLGCVSLESKTIIYMAKYHIFVVQTVGRKNIGNTSTAE